MKRMIFLAVLMVAAAACGTLSPRDRLQNQFVDIGLSKDRAGCLASELDDRLNKDDLNNVADFVDGMNAADSANEVIDALLSIDNPQAAQAIARAGISCAFGG